MNQSIRWRRWLVNISGQLWPICSIQVLLIGQGSSQHISAILDYAHDLLSVVNGWWALSTPQKSNAVTLPSNIKLRLPKIIHKFIGFCLNMSEIWSSFERELLRLKWVTPSKESPRLVGNCLVSVYEFHQIFNISYFPHFNLSFKKKYLCPKMTKNQP